LTTNAGWIESRRYDLWLLALPPLIGLVIATFAGRVDSAVIAGASLFLLGMPHYLSTYAFYLDDKNLAYARTRKVAFFAGPILVVFFLTATMALHFYMFVALWVDAWNVFHVSRQSVGILGVYRHLNGGDNRLEKLPANVALIAIAGGMYAVTIVKQPSFMWLFRFLPFPIAPYLGPALLAIGAIGLTVLLLRMFRRGARLFSPEMIFLVTSILLFAPYMLISSRTTASSAMLSGHYLQYLGILWLLNHRKYDGERGSVAQRALGWVSKSAPRIVILLLSIVAATTLVDRYVHHINAMGFHNWLLNLVVLMHFYLDGVFWAFKHRHTRESIGPYLVLPDHRVAAAATGSIASPVPAV
jgi:hypothetical protein